MPPNSNDSPEPSKTPSTSGAEGERRFTSIPPSAANGAWRTNLVLFFITLASVFVTGIQWKEGLTRATMIEAGQFTGALLTILLAHEFAHYLAARIHNVDASLPYFIPMPMLSPFGTMGAVIRMRGTIATRRALLDIGASGPLAGLILAIPMYLWGVAHSRVIPLDTPDMMELGESLALRLFDRIAAPHVPEGMTLELSPVAFAAWGGMFVTMINLLPVGQLDGGHVAYALFGPRQNKFAVTVHRAMLAFFFVSLGSFMFRDFRAGIGFAHIGRNVGNSMAWLVWFEMLAVLGSAASKPSLEIGTVNARTRIFAVIGLIALASFGREHSKPFIWIAWFVGLALLLAIEVRGGALRPHTLLDHPPTGDEPLDTKRKVIAVITLACFIALFMPTPMSM